MSHNFLPGLSADDSLPPNVGKERGLTLNKNIKHFSIQSTGLIYAHSLMRSKSPLNVDTINQFYRSGNCHRNVIAQGHIAGKWQTQNLGPLSPKNQAFIHISFCFHLRREVLQRKLYVQCGMQHAMLRSRGQMLLGITSISLSPLKAQ